MALLDDLVQRYAQADLSIIFREVDATDNRQVNLTAIPPDHFSHLKEGLGRSKPATNLRTCALTHCVDFYCIQALLNCLL